MISHHIIDVSIQKYFVFLMIRSKQVFEIIIHSKKYQILPWYFMQISMRMELVSLEQMEDMSIFV